MKKLVKLFSVATLVVASNACSFANKSTVTVPITSNPPGASVVIDGKNYGQTPAFVELKPSKNYSATLMKDGYAPATINMESWYSVRGGDGSDGGRCIADIGAFVVPYFVVLLFAPEKCASFKEESYYADLTVNKLPSNNAPYGYNNSTNSGY